MNLAGSKLYLEANEWASWFSLTLCFDLCVRFTFQWYSKWEFLQVVLIIFFQFHFKRLLRNFTLKSSASRPLILRSICLLMQALLYTFNWSKFSWALGTKRKWMSNASVNRYVWCTLKMFSLVITREIRRCKSVKAEAMHENILVVIFPLINFW